MLETMPPWMKKAWGQYLRQAKHWQGGDKYLESILIFYFGVTPPPGEAEKYAMALAQRLAPLGRPRKDSQQWKQLTLPLDNPQPHQPNH